jgi:hypothetical protein
MAIILFVSDAKSLSNRRKSIQDENENPKSPQVDKFFLLLNLYKFHNLYTLIMCYLSIHVLDD